jgi:nucleoside-diphosphate-sugar epimerase
MEKLGMDMEPVRAPLPLGEPRDSVADITRARRLLGYDPHTRIEHVIGEVIESVRRSASPSGAPPSPAYQGRP